LCQHDPNQLGPTSSASFWPISKCYTSKDGQFHGQSNGDRTCYRTYVLRWVFDQFQSAIPQKMDNFKAYPTVIVRVIGRTSFGEFLTNFKVLYLKRWAISRPFQRWSYVLSDVRPSDGISPGMLACLKKKIMKFEKKNKHVLEKNKHVNLRKK